MLLNEQLEIAITCHGKSVVQHAFLPLHLHKFDWLISGPNLERFIVIYSIMSLFIINSYYLPLHIRICNGGQHELFGKHLLISVFGMLPWVHIDSFGNVSRVQCSY